MAQTPTHVFGSNGAIDYISYGPEYERGAQIVLREAFLPHESIAVATEIYNSEQGTRDFFNFCACIGSLGISICARETATDRIVGLCYNIIKPQCTGPNEKSFFEEFRDSSCLSNNTREFIQVLINMNTRYELTVKDCALEIVLVAVLREFSQLHIVRTLIDHTIELAKSMMNGVYLRNLPDETKNARPTQVISSFTTIPSQTISRRLGFRKYVEVPLESLSYGGLTYANKLENEPNSIILSAIDLQTYES